MRLTALRLAQLRQFQEPFELTGLTPGINLFTGPNEAGKSTLVAAIRAAFFERHRSGSVDHLQPWGDPTASPTVELAFEIGERTYRLTKSFLGRKRCVLQIGRETLEGVAAEDHLAELLGFQYAGRGASTSEHWGVPGLLWIEQGAAQEIQDPVTAATVHLRSALHGSLGAITSSTGDVILDEVARLRDALLNAAGKPRGAYAEAVQTESRLTQTLAETEGQIREYRVQVDALAGLQREQQTDEAERPWDLARTQRQAAAEELRKVQELAAALERDQARLQEIEGQGTLLRAQLEQLAGEEQEADARAAALAAADTVRTEAITRRDRAEQARNAAEACHAAAHRLLQNVNQETLRTQRIEEIAELRRQLEATLRTCNEADAVRARLRARQTEAARLELKDCDLEQLRTQQHLLRERQIQRAAAATRLRFTLTAGQTLELGAEALTGTGERLLLKTTTLHLPGFGEIEIVPGGTDLGTLERQETEAGDRLQALLQEWGLEGLEAAEARHQAWNTCLQEIRADEATIRQLAPEGTDALRDYAAVLEARLEQALQILAGMTPTPDDLPQLLSLSQAQRDEDTARQALQQADLNLNQAQLALATTQADFKSAQAEQERTQRRLDAPDRASRQAAFSQALTEVRAEQQTLQIRIHEQAPQRVPGRAEILQQDVDRYGNSAQELEEAFRTRAQQIAHLQGVLQAAGTAGLEERRAELVRDLAQTGRRVSELRRRAETLEYLLGLLREKRAALTRQLHAPLQRHLSHYLQMLFPQAEVALDEDLAPSLLTRDGQPGVLGQLSFGAREQMGVLTRLAYADLLQGAGRPTLVILDDALVHADEERLGQMKRVLFDAATRHQILLFTCHPARWRDLGVAARPLLGPR
ncbi:MAG: AAA family ATPase [Acidimicrobiales bacterium]